MKQLIIIGIDGLRADIFEQIKPVNIFNFFKSGTFSFDAQTVSLTNSGPSWTSLFTGVFPHRHLVRDNSFFGNNLKEFPTFIEQAKIKKTNFKFKSLTNWLPLKEKLFRGLDAINFDSDQLVIEEAISVIKEKNHEVVFLHLDEIDCAGHMYGFDNNLNYLEAIKKTDCILKPLLETLESREDEMLVLLISDHGGVGKEHGQDVPECRNIVFASSRKLEDAESPSSISITDIAPTSLNYLGYPVKDPYFDGKVLYFSNQI